MSNEGINLGENSKMAEGNEIEEVMKVEESVASLCRSKGLTVCTIAESDPSQW